MNERNKASQSEGLVSREEVTAQVYFSQLFFMRLPLSLMKEVEKLWAK